MPITLRATEMAYRDNSGQYVGINSVSERTTAEQIAAVEAAGEHVLEDIIPHDWTELTEDFDDIKEKIVMSSVNEPDEENNRIWLKPVASEIAIPTYSEFNEAKDSSVPFPVYPESKYGTSGQSLRTLGNGKTQWTDIGLPSDEQTTTAINTWLNNHPEATTTVQDGSVTEDKFADALKRKAVNEYVTPEMYGAVGDGVNDDSVAVQNAFNDGNKWIILSKTYKVTRTINVYSKTSAVFTKGGRISTNCGADPLFLLDHVSNVTFRGEGSGSSCVVGTCGNVFDISGTTDWESAPSNYATFIEFNDLCVSSGNIKCVCAFHHAVKQIHINHCTFYAKSAILSDGKAIEVTIDNSVLWGTDENGTSINISSAEGSSRYNEGWNITNCTIDGAGKAFTISDIFVLQVANCYIGKPVELSKPTTTTHTEKVSFIGNIIYSSIRTISAPTGVSYFMRIDNNTFVDGSIRLNGNTAYVSISDCTFTYNTNQNGTAIVLYNNVSNVTVDNINIDSTYVAGVSVVGSNGDNIRMSNVLWDKTTSPIYIERPVLLGESKEKKYVFSMISPGTKSSSDDIATITKRCAIGENGIIIVKARFYEVPSDNDNIHLIPSGTGVLSLPSATGSSSTYILLKSGKNDVMYVVPYYCTTSGTVTISLKSSSTVKVDYHGFLAMKRD